MPFPSYEDPEGEIADLLKLPQNTPVTLFLDEQHKVAYLHQGGYRSAADLAAVAAARSESHIDAVRVVRMRPDLSVFDVPLIDV